jgi:hypothetical protein
MRRATVVLPVPGEPVKDMVTLPVEGLPIHRQWYITYLATAPLHAGALAFIEFLRAHGGPG